MAGRQQQVRQEERPPQTQPRKKKRVRRFYNYSLLFTVIFVTVFGLIMIYSASSYTAQLMYGDAGYFMKKQALIAAGGLVVMVIISKINYHFFAKFAALAYVMSYVFMIAVSLFGRVVNGKRRWLGVGPLSFQPTEFVKVALIVTLAVVITRMGGHINRFKNMVMVGVMALPLAVLVAANNLSSGIIICGIVFVMLFVATKKKLIFGACVGAAGVVYCFAGQIGHALEAIGLLQSYQLERINVWLNPEAFSQEGGFQVLQGLYAIGSGGLLGKGLGESVQKMGFLPEAQNDMIFSIICEELGLFGAVSVIFIFLFMIYQFMIVANSAPDLFGALLVVGVMAHIAIQVILNIAVVTNSIPNTGITLPFISYGGTSVLFLMVEMGIVLSVSNQIKLEK
ncbi:MAG TPA: FtsW/RodA/SpoVE family cell cycle protein [Candidatus Lachnoclostridium pullistercoris]|uniref:Probable peptidoglycan glycosyltransferase FtsW n=1 Tax=Candidatus Lachnoclostridium pullistercoris TaxID=2838632 RepID=A0A9D2PCV7_9FIRM|nr:FtsW/RodA/SpoVE family cell cycle protein [Candidatus Lachnoclostridium pullistercoris]